MSDESQSIVNAVKDALQEEARKICDQEAEAAAARVRDRVKAKVAEVSATLFNEMSFERIGSRLRIEVSFPSGGKP